MSIKDIDLRESRIRIILSTVTVAATGIKCRLIENLLDAFTSLKLVAALAHRQSLAPIVMTVDAPLICFARCCRIIGHIFSIKARRLKVTGSASFCKDTCAEWRRLSTTTSPTTTRMTNLNAGMLVGILIIT